MPVLRTAVALIATVILVGMPVSVFAQNAAPPNAPAEKTIGVPSTPDATKVEPSLIVMNAVGATLNDNKLTLTGVAPSAIIFADRPTWWPACAHRYLLEEWGSAADASFAKDPPNATVSAFSKDGSLTRDAVVVLKNRNLRGDQLTFEVQVLEGDLEGADGPASVFIDIIGLPFTPLSFAGVARRTAYRAAMYNAATHPYYGYPPVLSAAAALWLLSASAMLLTDGPANRYVR